MSHPVSIHPGNPGVAHSVPTAFECSGYGMGHAWVTEDGLNLDLDALGEYTGNSQLSFCILMIH